eukprot:sb/3478995/
MSRYLLVPADKGSVKELKLPGDLVVAPETNNPTMLRSLLDAFEKAGICRKENGHLCYNDSDTGLNYDEFVKDCINLRFHREMNELYNVLYANGFKF